MESLENHENRYCGPTFTEINVRHQEFWRERAERAARQLRDEYLAQETFSDLLEQFQQEVPFHRQRTFDMLLDKAEQRINDHRARFLGEVRRENGRQGGNRRKSDRLQELIDEIVAKSPGVDCPLLLRLLSDKQGAGVIVETDEEEIFFVNDNGREKSAKIAGLKDRLCRAKKKFESQKAVRASEY